MAGPASRCVQHACRVACSVPGLLAMHAPVQVGTGALVLRWDAHYKRAAHLLDHACM